MELRQIRYALSVARERSFTRAADRLNVSQSAVSEQVRMLEESIGFSLFRRTPRGIEVTEAGRTFFYEAERVVGDFDSLGDIARRLKRAPSETFTLAMGSGMAQIVIPKLFHAVPDSLRTVRLDILTAPTRTIFALLAEEKIDAGLAIESDPEHVPPGIVFEPLAQAELTLITHPAHPLARGTRAVDLGRLVLEPIVMSELSVGYGRVVHAMFADLGIRPNILAVADNIETIKVIVQSGRGLAIVPRACVDNEVALGVLRALPIAPQRNIHMNLYRRRQALSRRKESHFSVVRAALVR
ncbi:LysR family transcriptional regulator [Rhodoplanes azumiensis]|uniref:LysR family transcriptional regulator n=1 Tax=Rhodoplanes azumiensis TaxID=1897628 RepID=A0ABW5ADQ0_9BRAD